MGKLYIVGMGTGDMGDLTMKAIDRINSKDKKIIRTEKHPITNYLVEKGLEFESLDYLYESKEDLEDVYIEIVEKIKVDIEGQDISYLVPGDPLIGEKTVEILLKTGLDIEIISGISFLENILKLSNKTIVDDIKVIDSTDIKYGKLDINIDTIIHNVYNHRILSELKIILGEYYGDEHSIFLINNNGNINDVEISKIPIYELDRNKDILAFSSVYLPKVNKKEEHIYDFNDLVEIMDTLRGENGCPWDKEQDHKSLRRYLIEECFELVDAIDSGDVDNIVEELGDVLLQVLFHTNIAFEEGEFNIIDITSSLANKLIYRHPHIFLEKKVENSKEVVYNWIKLKDSKKGLNSVREKLMDIPRASVLNRAYKVQQRAKAFGFDWDDIKGPLNKVNEEYKEIIEELEKEPRNLERIEGELGDLFFAVVNLSRFLNISPEIALNKTIDKFINRILCMENMAEEKGYTLEGLSLEQMDELWERSKKK